MANFTAADIKALREATGAGMMDAKKALTENGGDFEAATKWLREQGLSREQDSLRTPAFVALPLAPTVAPGPVASPVTPAPTQASPSQDLIRVEIQRAGATVTMQWPVSAAAQCAQMLRELLR